MKLFNTHIIKISLMSMVLLYAHSANAGLNDPEEKFFQKTFGDYKEELDLVRGQGKIGILIMFEQDECPYCYRMRTTILNQPAIQKYF